MLEKILYIRRTIHLKKSFSEILNSRTKILYLFIIILVPLLPIEFWFHVTQKTYKFWGDTDIIIIFFLFWEINS